MNIERPTLSWNALRALACVVIVAAPVFAPAAVASASATSDPATGVWQKHEYSFAYLGFTSTYSCDGLASKLKLLLIAAGARADSKVTAGACASGFGRPDKFARADLTFYTLAPVSAGQSPAGTPVDGAWKAVAFADQRPHELGRGDCELVEQFRHSVLPMFAIRGLENHTTCIPYQESGSIIDLRFESLALAPKPQGNKSG